MKLVVKNKMMYEYSIDSNNIIGTKKYLGKLDTNYYIYGEDPKDFLVNIYLGPFNKDGEFNYFRVGTYDNKVQWNGVCKKSE